MTPQAISAALSSFTSFGIATACEASTTTYSANAPVRMPCTSGVPPAVSGLRSDGIQLTAEDRGELLATVDESLNQLTQLLASLLDVSRLQAGALPVFPRPAELEGIIERCLGGIGPQACTVVVRLPPGLPLVAVDPPIMERVIANLTANALRYSPSGSPPLLTASARGGRVIGARAGVLPSPPDGYDVGNHWTLSGF